MGFSSLPLWGWDFVLFYFVVVCCWLLWRVVVQLFLLDEPLFELVLHCLLEKI